MRDGAEGEGAGRTGDLGVESIAHQAQCSQRSQRQAGEGGEGDWGDERSRHGSAELDVVKLGRGKVRLVCTGYVD